MILSRRSVELAMGLGSIKISKNRRTRKRKYPSPYRSEMEYRIHKGPMKRHEFEPSWAKTPYVIKGKTYNPDFASKDNPNILYEVKGRFRTHEEAKKYIHVIESNPELTIRFIISNPTTRAYPQTKMHMGDWLTKYGFEWCTEEDIPHDWR